MAAFSRIAAAFAALATLATPVWAQNTYYGPADWKAGTSTVINGRTVFIPNVISTPGGASASTSTSTGGTITTANTYQSVLASNTSRKGCLIQNTSTNVELAFLGAPGSATAATSISIPAGGTFNCASPGGLVISDQISLTSATASSAYVVVSQ